MHAEASRWQKRLNREFFPGSGLKVVWDEEMGRFRIGQKVRDGAFEYVDWFYTVTDGNSGFKPIDMRTVRKLYSMDKSRMKMPTADDIRKAMADGKARDEMKKSEELRYRIKHEAQFVGGRWGFDA
jgi:hypothetical protein